MDTFINTPEATEQIAANHNIGRSIGWLAAERANPEQFMAAHRLAEEFVNVGCSKELVPKALGTYLASHPRRLAALHCDRIQS